LPKKYPPLTPDEVIQILKARKFTLDSTRGDHQQWEGFIRDRKRKVTVDTGEKDFDDEIIKSMINQSGLSRDEFYCSTDRTARKINKRLKK